MEIAERKVGTVTVITLDGRLDTQTAGSFQQRWTGLVGRGDRKFLIDLDKLSFVSSAGVRVLLLAARQVQELAGALFVCRPNPQLDQIFEIAGISRLIPVRA